MKGAVWLIDTSVFCEFLQVPTLYDARRSKEVAEQVRCLKQDGCALLLPMATLIETGNHIGQNGDGQQRRHAADRFVKLVQAALDRVGPFQTTDFPDRPVIMQWLSVFPDYAQSSNAKGKGMGLGDVSIVHEWERQRELNPHRLVAIWSFDVQLSSYGA